MGKKHYIAMAGLHGYLPQYCDVFPEYDMAVDALASLHNLGRDRKRALKRDGYLELTLYRDETKFPFIPGDGNEYCEIEECDCDDPSIHSDSGEYDYD